jgi:hypothetical protein
MLSVIAKQAAQKRSGDTTNHGATKPPGRTADASTRSGRRGRSFAPHVWGERVREVRHGERLPPFCQEGWEVFACNKNGPNGPFSSVKTPKSANLLQNRSL